MIKGVDRSHLNAPFPLIKLVNEGYSFCFFKATQADTYKDPTFNQSWQEAKSTPGLIRGAYHFFDPRVDGVAQAKNFLSLGIDFTKPGCLPPWVDVEDLTGPSAAMANKWVYDNWKTVLQRLNDFLSHVKDKTGRVCGIYSYNNYMREYYRATAFPNNPMWLSSLQSTSPLRYDTGKLPEFWQDTYNENHTDMDGDFFTGTIDELRGMANITANQANLNGSQTTNQNVNFNLN